MDYTARTTPPDCCVVGFRVFDEAIRDAFDKITGTNVSDHEWAQAVLPLRDAGLGFHSALHVADAAYYASRCATQIHCVAVNPQFLQSRYARHVAAPPTVLRGRRTISYHSVTCPASPCILQPPCFVVLRLLAQR